MNILKSITVLCLSSIIILSCNDDDENLLNDDSSVIETEEDGKLTFRSTTYIWTEPEFCHIGVYSPFENYDDPNHFSTFLTIGDEGVTRISGELFSPGTDKFQPGLYDIIYDDDLGNFTKEELSDRFICTRLKLEIDGRGEDTHEAIEGQVQVLQNSGNNYTVKINARVRNQFDNTSEVREISFSYTDNYDISDCSGW